MAATKVTPITFDKPVYLSPYNSLNNSYLCEKPGYVVFKFDKSKQVCGKCASLCIAETDRIWSEEINFLPSPSLVHEVDKNSCIYVCAGSRIYVNFELNPSDPCITAKFIPITHNFDRNKSIVKQAIDNNSTKNTYINEAAGELLK
jgi:hypothetical protein